MRVLSICLTFALAACASHKASESSSMPGEARESASKSSDAFMGGLTEAEFKALHAVPAGSTPALKGIEIQAGDAKAYLSLPPNAKAPLPGVVVVHEWWGLNDNVKHWTDRIAAEGYAALAVDLYGGTIAKTTDEAMAAIKKVDDEAALATMRAAHAFLVKDERVRAPRTASIGWCFGGRKSLELAIAEPELDGAVVYYGTPETDPAKLAPMKAELLGVFGSRDKSISAEKLTAFESALKTADKKHAIEQYDADHAFANPSNPRYDEANAGKAWESTRAFLKRVLKP